MDRRQFLQWGSCLTFASFAGCSSSVGDDQRSNAVENGTETADDFTTYNEEWPMYHHDPQNTGVNRVPTQFDSETIEEAWRNDYSSGYTFRSPPIVADGTVYSTLGHRRGVNLKARLIATNSRTGKEVWSYTPPEQERDPFVQTGVPAIFDNLLFLVTNERILALDKDTGEVKWTYGEGASRVGNPSGFPIASQGIVLIGDHGSRLHGLDAIEGQYLWNFDPGVVEGVVAMSQGMVVADGRRGDPPTIYGIDARSGVEAWRFELEDAVVGGPSIQNDTVYFPTDSSLYALDLNTGEKVWEANEGTNKIQGPMTVFEDRLVGYHKGGGFSAFNPNNGERLWARPLINVIGKPSATEQFIFFPPGVRVIGTEGRLKWSTDVTQYASSPTVIDGWVYYWSYNKSSDGIFLSALQWD